MNDAVKVTDSTNSSKAGETSPLLGRKPVQAGVPLPKFMQLKNHFLKQLESGELKTGVAIPSETRLAEQFGISRGTVRQTLSEMEQEGLIRREKGRGTFVSDIAEDNTKQSHQVATLTFALVVKSENRDMMPLIRGFDQACRSSHHHMVVHDTQNDIDQQADVILRLSLREVDGVAILPVNAPPTPHHHIAVLQNHDIPVVFCYRRTEKTRGPMLSTCDDEQHRLLAQAFSDKGHRRVAMVNNEWVEGFTEKWERDLRASLGRNGVEMPEEFVYGHRDSSRDCSKFESGLPKKLEEMLGSENPPTAIFVASEAFAQAVYFDLTRMGLRVPEDISLIGNGGVTDEGAFSQRLSSVVTDSEDTGRQAVELLNQMHSRQRDLSDNNTIWIPQTLNDGQTLGPPPKTPVRYCRASHKVIRE